MSPFDRLKEQPLRLQALGRRASAVGVAIRRSQIAAGMIGEITDLARAYVQQPDVCRPLRDDTNAT